MTKALEKIFSVKNDKDKKHKVVNVCGLKIKIKKNNIKKLKCFYENNKIMMDPSLYVGIPENITLQLMLNNDCNCRCSFCSAHNENKQTRKLIPQKWLYDDFKPLYPKVKNLVPTYGEITYGREGYEYISWICKNYPHINISLETNGILFNEKWYKLATNNLFSVNFSINAIDEESFKNTVWNKPGVFTVVKKNITDYLIYLKEQNLYQFKPSVSCVLNSTNYGIVESFVKMALQWKLQKIIFFFDTRENNMDNLTVKDKENFEKALLTLLELEKLLQDKVRLAFRLFIPINNICDYEKLVEEINIDNLKSKYKDIWELAQDLDLYENYLLKKKEYEKQNKHITFYEDLTGVTYHQKECNGIIVCENAWNHLRLRADGCMSVCSWRGYSDKYKINTYIKNDKIDFKALFNDLYHRRLRKEYLQGKYSGCMKNCPSAQSILATDFKQLYKTDAK